MRVALDASFARRGPSGTAVYVERLAEALRALGAEVVELADERRRAPAGGGPGSVRNALRDRRWVTRELPALAREAGADVLHHPLPAFAPHAGLPQVVTVHDLAFELHPERFDLRFRLWARRTHRRAARRAGAVVCPSRATARLVAERWGVTGAVVAPHGPGQELPPVPARAPEHVLYVGDDEPRKNLALLREAQLPLPLRIAGRAARPVTPAELAELHAGALALVHPSLDEGFGLTLLEAMAAGTPVVAVPSAAAREVCGDAALWVDPRDPAPLAGALARLVAEPELREELIRRGRARAGRFSWEASARAHLLAYERAVG